jgi:hypothetical protein
MVFTGYTNNQQGFWSSARLDYFLAAHIDDDRCPIGSRHGAGSLQEVQSSKVFSRKYARDKKKYR